MSNYVMRSDLGGVWDDIWSGVKKVGSAAEGAVESYGAAKGQAQAYQNQAAAAGQSKMPSWLLPVGIGAGALVLIMVLRKKKR